MLDIQENIFLSDYTTFKIGGLAKYFAVIKNVEDLEYAANFAKQNSLRIFVLGGGSNLLVSDKGVDGFVLKIEIGGIYFEEKDVDDVTVIVGAGEIWDDFVNKTVEQNLYGLENLSYIPGTVGASVVQNIGAYGVEVKDTVNWVEVFDLEKKETKKFTGVFCKFGYRDSIFKKPEGKNFVVIKVAYNLQKNGKLNLKYKDIGEYLGGKDGEKSHLSLSVKDLRNAIVQIRKNKLPDWKKIGTAGSFFKNPIVTNEQLEKILRRYPEIPNFDCGNGEHKIPLAYVLDKILGLKGLREGDVGLYENQPLAIVNYKNATSQQIKNFARKIQKKVKERLSLDIEPEVVEW